MEWTFLFWLGEPWFVIPWYAVGLLGAGYVIYDQRNHNSAPIADERAALTPVATPAASALFAGLRATLDRARAGLGAGDRTRAALALDEALRAAEVGAFSAALEQIRNARYALQQGQADAAAAHVANARRVLRPPARDARPALLEEGKYGGARVLDANGATIGEVTAVRRGRLELALGGWRDLCGFIDRGGGRTVEVPAGALAFGAPHAVGLTLVALPTRAR